MAYSKSTIIQDSVTFGNDTLKYNLNGTDVFLGLIKLDFIVFDIVSNRVNNISTPIGSQYGSIKEYSTQSDDRINFAAKIISNQNDSKLNYTSLELLQLFKYINQGAIDKFNAETNVTVGIPGGAPLTTLSINDVIRLANGGIKLQNKPFNVTMPLEDIKKLYQIMKAPIPIPITNQVLNALGINSLLLDGEITFSFREGESNCIYVNWSMVSDYFVNVFIY